MFSPLEFGSSSKSVPLNHVNTLENSSAPAVYVFGIFCAVLKDHRLGIPAFYPASGPGIGCVERILYGVEEFQCSA